MKIISNTRFFWLGVILTLSSFSTIYAFAAPPSLGKLWTCPDDGSTTYDVPVGPDLNVKFTKFSGGSFDTSIDLVVKDSNGTVVGTCSLTDADPFCTISVPGGGTVTFSDSADGDSNSGAGSAAVV